MFIYAIILFYEISESEVYLSVHGILPLRFYIFFFYIRLTALLVLFLVNSKNQPLKTTIQLPRTYLLQHIIGETLQRCKPLATHYQIELEVMDDLASLVTVVGDAAMQKKLFELVITNTIKHSKASKIVFGARQLLQTEKDTLLEFSLTDDGTHPKLSSGNFGYFRSLITAKKMIESLSGKTELIAAPGLNTTLKFIIRYQWQNTAVAVQHAQPGYGNSMAGKKLLVAEDNEVNQKVIQRILIKEGISADFVSNGKEAVEACERKGSEYDLLLMDLQMPYMDGFQAALYIRKKLCSSIPIVALTIGAAEDNYARCMEAGMNHFIKKPFSAAELLTVISQCLLTKYEAAC